MTLIRNIIANLRVGSTDVTETNPVPITPSPFTLDSGGRIRTSNMTQLFDGKVLGSDNTDYWDVQGDGTSTFYKNTVIMSADTGQYLVRETNRHLPYIAGHSQLIEITCDNFQTETGIQKNLGYFSSSFVAPFTGETDGIVIEDDGIQKHLRVYNKGTRTLDVPFTGMTNYNLISGYTYDNFTIFGIDFLWLGGAQVRFFQKLDSGFRLIHSQPYAGSAPGTMMESPNQPVRFEIRNISGSNTYFKYICANVATEGSVGQSGSLNTFVNETDITTNSNTTTYALLGVKANDTYHDISTKIESYGVVLSSNDSGMVYVLKNPTLSAPITYSGGTVDVGVATNQTISDNGTIIHAVPAWRGAAADLSEDFLSYLTVTLDGTYDEFVLAYRPITSNTSARGVLTTKSYQ
jgi:hypothetical protein